MGIMKKILLLTVLALGATSASAQFTVPRNVGREGAIRNPADTVRTITAQEMRGDEAYSPARRKAIRRAIRKERNLIELTTNLNATQTQFDNWSSGGENTFSAMSGILFKHQFKHEGFGLENRFDAKYGMNYIERKAFKNQDVFQFNTIATWVAEGAWSWATDMELRSQFAKGYRSRTDKTMISNFMAPGFFKVAVGVVYKKSPWTISISPIGGSATLVLDKELSARGINGVTKGEKAKWMMGPSLRIIFEKGWAKDAVKIRSEAYSFTNIKTAPTARWETRIDLRATKFLTTTLYSLMQYDKTANTPRRDHIQHQYSIMVGLSYTFRNK